jgi:hypothetical protein
VAQTFVGKAAKIAGSYQILSSQGISMHSEKQSPASAFNGKIVASLFIVARA